MLVAVDCGLPWLGSTELPRPAPRIRWCVCVCVCVCPSSSLVLLYTNTTLRRFKSDKGLSGDVNALLLLANPGHHILVTSGKAEDAAPLTIMLHCTVIW
ncbi:hypothetical protein E2C01_015451 [Portunus trituberculatus]|uniref:Uncharacterized protein n=1 Tax=Portunus trituberculatus TaxID=210409 RepID=A0A5B7DN80_PORTR|nr:hypothetical protein [Portunus trituberculatus]